MEITGLTKRGVPSPALAMVGSRASLGSISSMKAMPKRLSWIQRDGSRHPADVAQIDVQLGTAGHFHLAFGHHAAAREIAHL